MTSETDASEQNAETSDSALAFEVVPQRTAQAEPQTSPQAETQPTSQAPLAATDPFGASAQQVPTEQVKWLQEVENPAPAYGHHKERSGTATAGAPPSGPAAAEQSGVLVGGLPATTPATTPAATPTATPAATPAAMPPAMTAADAPPADNAALADVLVDLDRPAQGQSVPGQPPNQPLGRTPQPAKPQPIPGQYSGYFTGRYREQYSSQVLVKDPRTPHPLQSLVAVILAAAVIAIAVVAPFTATSIFVTDMTQVAAYAVAFAGLSLITQHLGLLSLGQGAFAGVGAVAAQHSINELGFPLLAMPAVGLLAGLALGLLLGIPALRLPKAYLALLTLSAAVVFPIVLRQVDGPLPVTLDGEFLPPSWIGIEARDEHIWEYLIVVAWAVVVLIGLQRLLKGPVGRALEASSKPEAAAAFGIPVYRLRLSAVALGGGLAGLAGGLLLTANNLTSGDQYPEELSIKMFALVIAFGAVAKAKSALLRVMAYIGAASVLVFLPVWLEDRPEILLQGGWAGLVKSEGFIYAALLLAIALVAGLVARRSGQRASPTGY